MILIDIDMPESCGNCPLNDDDWSCIIAGTAPAKEGRRKNCPLHEIVIETDCISTTGRKEIRASLN